MQPSITQIALRIEVAARCRVVDGDDIDSAWLSVLPGLHALYEQESAQDWDIDGIRKLLDSGRGLLVIDEDDPSGFVVIQIDAAPFDGEALELFVYLAFHQGGRAIERFQPHLEHMARTGGAKYMRFFSRRPGMQKVAASVGYHTRSVEYVKELQ